MMCKVAFCRKEFPIPIDMMQAFVQGGGPMSLASWASAAASW